MLMLLLLLSLLFDCLFVLVLLVPFLDRLCVT